MRNFIKAALLIASIVNPAAAQNQSISGPVLGFTADSTGAAISPILGVVGASVFGRPLEMASEVGHLIISPEQDYALGVRKEDAQIVLIRIAEDARISVLSQLQAGADLIAISPGGTAAAVYNRGSRLLQTIKGMPETPELVVEFDASLISGAPDRLAVSDDGTVVLANFAEADRSSAWVAAAGGSLKRLASGHLSAMAFLAGRHDAILSDDAFQEVFLVTDVEGAATRVPLISLDGPPGASIQTAASKDGRLAVVITSQSRGITIVDAGTLTHIDIACPCWPTSLRRLKGNGVFSLNEPSDGLLYVLDASLPEPRIVVIPPILAPSGLEFLGPETQ